MLNLADLEARAARLESRNYVSMRYGRVTGTKDGEAQIQLNDAEGPAFICRSAPSMPMMLFSLKTMVLSRRLSVWGAGAARN